MPEDNFNLKSQFKIELNFSNQDDVKTLDS